MKLVLERKTHELTCTLGDLSIDGKFFCYVLEDVVREDDRPVQEWKIKGDTAIPKGEYVVQLTLSNRFQKVMPQLMNVPGFEGIRIHAGNTNVDTDGCLLVGMALGVESVLRSREAYDLLMAKLTPVSKAGEVITIEVK